MEMFELRKKSLAALLLAFMASAMMIGCSSTEETEDAPAPQEASGDCDNPANADEAERCLQDLDI